MKKSIALRTALGAILCAQALALGFLENLIPPLPFLPPGAKPGFSNIITMFAAGSLGLPQALTITLVKGAFAFVTRGFTAGIMSLSGGLLSTLAMWLLLKFAGNKLGLVGISVICALCHNAGQLGTAAVITGSGDIIYYAPALAVFGIATGTVTGIILKAVIPVLEKQKQYFYR
ncbi:MAG: Gx transporter family protein [Clostridia bacterium]|nr:Gx transporter family protein [Clostridia bacterium]